MPENCTCNGKYDDLQRRFAALRDNLTGTLASYLFDSNLGHDYVPITEVHSRESRLNQIEAIANLLLASGNLKEMESDWVKSILSFAHSSSTITAQVNQTDAEVISKLADSLSTMKKLTGSEAAELLRSALGTAQS
jgi:hypothetical protein